MQVNDFDSFSDCSLTNTFDSTSLRNKFEKIAINHILVLFVVMFLFVMYILIPCLWNKNDWTSSGQCGGGKVLSYTSFCSRQQIELEARNEMNLFFFFPSFSSSNLWYKRIVLNFLHQFFSHFRYTFFHLSLLKDEEGNIRHLFQPLHSWSLLYLFPTFRPNVCL